MKIYSDFVNPNLQVKLSYKVIVEEKYINWRIGRTSNGRHKPWSNVPTLPSRPPFIKDVQPEVYLNQYKKSWSLTKKTFEFITYDQRTFHTIYTKLSMRESWELPNTQPNCNPVSTKSDWVSLSFSFSCYFYRVGCSYSLPSLCMSILRYLLVREGLKK